MLFACNVSNGQIEVNGNFGLELSENDSKAIVIEQSPNAFLTEAQNGDYRNKYVDSFTGIRDSLPFIYQVTELKAVPYENHYQFYCVFKDNTSKFKSKRFNNVTYYYSDSINVDKANEFAQFKDKLSELTETPKSSLDYYCFQSLGTGNK
ncbi:MAG: hypothetical protein ACJAWV_002198 [Flammeovirgaceae bacterium]|jgi:hypothetical protein